MSFCQLGSLCGVLQSIIFWGAFIKKAREEVGVFPGAPVCAPTGRSSAPWELVLFYGWCSPLSIVKVIYVL